MSTDYQTENDAFDFDAPESYQTGGAFLDAGDDGTYHVEVTAIERNPKKKNGDFIANAAFKASFVVLDGTNKACIGKSGNFIVFQPNFARGEKSVEFARKKIGRFFVATGLRNENDPTRDPSGNPIKVQVNLQAAVGRQFIVQMSTSEPEDKNEKPQIELHFAEMYHVDDPIKSGVPKDAAALANYPAQFRRKPESFISGKPGSKASGSTNGNGSSSAPAKSATSQTAKSATAASQSQAVTADDL